MHIHAIALVMMLGVDACDEVTEAVYTDAAEDDGEWVRIETEPQAEPPSPPSVAAVPEQGPPDITWSPEPGQVVFRHARHTGSAELACETCHPRLFAMKEHSTLITMEAMRAGDNCGGCHDGSEGTFGPDSCASCHLAPGQ